MAVHVNIDATIRCSVFRLHSGRRPNSPGLDVLDYCAWDAITNNMQWDKVKGYATLTDEIRKGIRRVLLSDLTRNL